MVKQIFNDKIWKSNSKFIALLTLTHPNIGHLSLDPASSNEYVNDPLNCMNNFMNGNSIFGKILLSSFLLYFGQ